MKKPEKSTALRYRNDAERGFSKVRGRNEV